jgi:exosortase O
MTRDGVLVPVEARSLPPWSRLLPTAVLLLSWGYLNLDALQWFIQLFRQLSAFNSLLLFATLAFLCIAALRYREAWTFSSTPMFRRAPIVLLLGSAIAALVSRWVLALDQLPVLCFILGSYGLLGLYFNFATWKKGLPVMAAIAFIIPFGFQVTAGLGFPARTFTAEVVELILKSAHIDAISSENIIVLDTGIAHVDLPCSGLKSLWLGSLLLFGMTALEQRVLGARWLIVFLTNWLLLILANIGRVLTLVLVAYVLNQSAIATMLHVPLGIFTFSTVGVMTWLMLRFVPQTQATIQQRETRSAKAIAGTKLNRRSLLLIVSSLVFLSFMPTPPATAVAPTNFAQLQWQGELQSKAIELNPTEKNFFAAFPGVSTHKEQFQLNGISGSMILVSTSTWQAHHAPELCFVSSGFRVNHMEQTQLTDEISGRWLNLNDGKQTAAYWFQSADRTTDNYLDRIWSEITRQEPKWTMVSILFDQSVQPDSPDVQAMVDQVHDAIATTMSHA